MNKQLLTLIVGLLIGAFFFGTTVAVAITQPVNVDPLILNYMIDGKQMSPSADQAGIIVDDKIYVPLNFMVE